MTYANNPQAFINGFYSSSRNVFLTVTVSIAIYGFSNTFNLDVSKNVVKDISVLIFIVSLCLGLNNILMLNNYINILEENEKSGIELPEYVDLNSWKRHMYIKILFLIILSLIIIITSKRLILRRF
jgi:hypothetical protein